MTYATGTTVTVQGSQQEIGRTFDRYRIETYAFGQAPGEATVSFIVRDLPIRLTIPLPPRPKTDKIRSATTGRVVDAIKPWEQDCREAWRALALLIKANLEAVERKLTTPEQAFMAYLVTPDNRLLHELVLPQYRDAVAANRALPVGTTS